MVLNDAVDGKSVTKLDKNYKIIWSFYFVYSFYLVRTIKISKSK
jgi:hypothetical protein